MKKIWLLCLCLASFSLVGCFHVPDEDWLPSKNNAETWNIQKDEEMEQALNSLMQWFDIISSDWNELKNEENEETISEEVENAINEFMDGVNLISSEWDEMNNEEDTGEKREKRENNNNEKISNNEIEDQEREDEDTNDEDIVTEE